MNEKIYDISEENKCLRLQLEELRNEAKSMKSSDSLTYKKTDKENIFRNNFIREQTKLKSLNVQENETSMIKSKPKNKSLEERVLELEKELKLRENSKDSNTFSDNPVESKISIAASHNRSKSAVKNSIQSDKKLLDSNFENSKSKLNKDKVKKKKPKLKSDEIKPAKKIEKKIDKSCITNSYISHASNVSSVTPTGSKTKVKFSKK